jgi:hypothetical protein
MSIGPTLKCGCFAHSKNVVHECVRDNKFVAARAIHLDADFKTVREQTGFETFFTKKEEGQELTTKYRFVENDPRQFIRYMYFNEPWMMSEDVNVFLHLPGDAGSRLLMYRSGSAFVRSWLLYYKVFRRLRTFKARREATVENTLVMQLNAPRDIGNEINNFF